MMMAWDENTESTVIYILRVKGWATLLLIILTAEVFGWAVPDTVLHMFILWEDKQDITCENKALVCLKHSHYMTYNSSSTKSTPQAINKRQSNTMTHSIFVCFI